MSGQKPIGSLLLLLTSVIWGVAFVAQSVGMDYIGPFTFNAVRFLLGGCTLLPVIAWRASKKSSQKQKDSISAERKKMTLLGGLCCGFAICTGTLLQQTGIQYTTVGKAGFITALYIILVPLFSIFLKKKVALRIWVSALIAVAGFYLLSVNGRVSLGKGDLLLLLGAVAFSFHIMIIDYFSPRGDSVQISCIQFFISAVLCSVGMLALEKPEPADILAAWIPVLYAGVLSCGVAYTLQIVGQKRVEPTLASLILSLESVVSVIAGWLILGQTLSAKEIGGCVLVFTAIILAQLPGRKRLTANLAPNV